MKYVFPALCWAIIIGGVLSACAKRPKPTLPNDPVPGVLIEDAKEEQAMPDPQETLAQLEPPNWTLFFDFDGYRLKDLYKAAALAEYLKKTGLSVSLAGHASSEGAAAYNLALGAKRAVAVRSYLEAAGIPESRILWRSYGEEAPFTLDPDKKHLNRRVEITLEDVR